MPPRLAVNPFSLPGRIVNDAQTSCKPASRVLISDPDLVRIFGIAGRWNEESRRVDYRPGTPDPEAGDMLDMEAALRLMISSIRRLDRERAATTMLLRSILHGAIAKGLDLHATKGTRQLNMGGGIALLVEQDEAGDYLIQRYTIPVINPLRFYAASGASLIDPTLFNALPAVCAGDGAGETVAWPAKTYRVDTLALIPKGDDPVPEWYVFLGRATTARTVDKIVDIPTPPIPAEYAAEVLPLYRIVTRQGDKGVHRVELIANRVTGV